MTRFTIFASILFFCFCFKSFAQEKPAQTSLLIGKDLIDEDDFLDFEENNVAKINDPLEKYNRKIFAFNDFVDRYFLEHVAIAYREKLPRQARLSIRRFLTNLTLPFSAANSLFQGKTDNALSTISSFLINSTIGVGGIFNVASKKGIAFTREDLGQTLGYYGVNSGYYLMIPILGPSSTRDFTGFAVTSAVNPLNFNVFEVGGKVELIDLKYTIALATLTGIDQRERLIEIISDIRQDSFDPYATIRSAYLQRRESEIKN